MQNKDIWKLNKPTTTKVLTTLDVKYYSDVYSIPIIPEDDHGKIIDHFLNLLIIKANQFPTLVTHVKIVFYRSWIHSVIYKKNEMKKALQ